MPRRRTPCPECGQSKKSESALCWPCNVAKRQKRYKAPQPVEVPITEAFSEPFPVEDSEPSVAGLKVMVIPDCQVKQDVDIRHLEWVGRYAADKRPDVIVNIGDFADMPSLSSYDRGTKSFEGRRYANDIAAAQRGMERLMGPIVSTPGYRPRLVLTLGNHEDRITRAVEQDAKLDGTIGLDDLRYEAYGWEVHPFLQPVEIGGCEFAHYFTSGIMGRPVTSARALLNARMGSAVMGHTQHTDIAFHPKTQHIGMFVGTCYLHDEDYLGAQGNAYRRQIVMMHELQEGLFDPMIVSLSFLKRRYA